MGARLLRSASVVAAVSAGIPAVAAGWIGAAWADPATPEPSPAPPLSAEAGPAVASAAGPGPSGTSAAGPVGVIDHDGIYTVGTEILPGVYTSAGPAEGTKCYWKRVGDGGAILDNALTAQPQVVQIEPTDVSFKTRGCQPWKLTDGATPAGQNPPWLSQFQFRHQLDVLNGLAGQSGNGQLPPY